MHTEWKHNSILTGEYIVFRLITVFFLSLCVSLCSLIFEVGIFPISSEAVKLGGQAMTASIPHFSPYLMTLGVTYAV